METYGPYALEQNSSIDATLINDYLNCWALIDMPP